MKKTLILILLSTALTACGGGEKDQDIPKQEEAQEVERKVAVTEPTELIQAFKDSGLPIGDVVIHSAESDPNNLLGRPDGYTASAHFEDTSVEQDQPFEEGETVLPKGGVIEVWGTQEKAEARKTYIEEVNNTFNMPGLKQYMYIHKDVLLRLEYDIIPDQAKKYEDVLKSL